MRHIRGPHLTKIITQKCCALFFIERLIDSEVPEVKEDIAHGGVFPIENPDPTPVIDKVAGKQVVMTWFGFMQRANGIFDYIALGDLEDGSWGVSSGKVTFS